MAVVYESRSRIFQPPLQGDQSLIGRHTARFVLAVGFVEEIATSLCLEVVVQFSEPSVNKMWHKEFFWIIKQGLATHWLGVRQYIFLSVVMPCINALNSVVIPCINVLNMRVLPCINDLNSVVIPCINDLNSVVMPCINDLNSVVIPCINDLNSVVMPCINDLNSVVMPCINDLNSVVMPLY